MSAPRAEPFSCIVPWFETNVCGVKSSTPRIPHKINYVIQHGETVFVQLDNVTLMKKKKNSKSYEPDPTPSKTTCPEFEVYHFNPPNTDDIDTGEVCKTSRIKLWTNCTGEAVYIYFQVDAEAADSWKFEGNYVFEVVPEHSCE